jgi:phosphoribosylanthranilate isomerase
MKLKICGMKLNTAEVAALRPDYLGFIFWEPSSRYFDVKIPTIPEGIKKVGVFVDAPIEEVLEKVSSYTLEAIQLHGNESAEYCKAISKVLKIKSDKIEIIKVFSIKSDFDFEQLNDYEQVCNYYLFDTKGKLPGGNGFTFDWSVLRKYPATKPYFLSGGIGLEHVEKIKEFMGLPESKYCHYIDVNSKFELEPGLKKIEELKEFKKVLSTK